MTADPAPDQNYFVRSDHYSFVKKGVPSISLATGINNGGAAAFSDYEARRYHQVSDDMSQKFSWDAGAKFARINYLIARDLVDATDPPRWYANDYFGGRFAKGQPTAPKP
jgi:Zn-dependent M28 family amino/carboxypeptidase